MCRGKLAVKLRSNFPKTFVPVVSGDRLKLAKIRLKRNTSAASQARNIEVTAPVLSEKKKKKQRFSFIFGLSKNCLPSPQTPEIENASRELG